MCDLKMNMRVGDRNLKADDKNERWGFERTKKDETQTPKRHDSKSGHKTRCLQDTQVQNSSRNSLRLSEVHA
jgi:hypothetical protein